MRIDDRLQLKQDSGPLGRAGGKAILVGEHFVLHGSRALALPVGGRFVAVKLTPVAGELRYVGPDEGRDLTLAMARHLGLAGVAVEVGGDLPLSAGLGSSAALGVALVRSTGVDDRARVQSLAHQLEQLAHGRASGIDDAVISHDQAVLFDPSASSGDRFRWLDVQAPPLWIAWIPRMKPTRMAVAGVSALAAADPARFAETTRRVAALVDPMLEALVEKAPERLGPPMAVAQRALEDIGVVVDEHRHLVDIALSHGAWGAKTTGAGWGGAVLVVGPRALDLDRRLAEHGFHQCFFAGDHGPDTAS